MDSIDGFVFSSLAFAFFSLFWEFFCFLLEEGRGDCCYRRCCFLSGLFLALGMTPLHYVFEMALIMHGAATDVVKYINPIGLTEVRICPGLFNLET